MDSIKKVFKNYDYNKISETQTFKSSKTDINISPVYRLSLNKLNNTDLVQCSPNELYRLDLTVNELGVKHIMYYPNKFSDIETILSYDIFEDLDKTDLDNEFISLAYDNLHDDSGAAIFSSNSLIMGLVHNTLIDKYKTMLKEKFNVKYTTLMDADNYLLSYKNYVESNVIEPIEDHVIHSSTLLKILDKIKYNLFNYNFHNDVIVNLHNMTKGCYFIINADSTKSLIFLYTGHRVPNVKIRKTAILQDIFSQEFSNHYYECDIYNIRKIIKHKFISEESIINKVITTDIVLSNDDFYNLDKSLQDLFFSGAFNNSKNEDLKIFINILSSCDLKKNFIKLAYIYFKYHSILLLTNDYGSAISRIYRSAFKQFASLVLTKKQLFELKSQQENNPLVISASDVYNLIACFEKFIDVLSYYDDINNGDIAYLISHFHNTMLNKAQIVKKTKHYHINYTVKCI